jgi:hypothetical protein
MTTAILGLCSYVTVSFEAAFNAQGAVALFCVYMLDGLFLLAVLYPNIIRIKHAGTRVQPTPLPLATQDRNPLWLWSLASLLPLELFALAAPSDQTELASAVLRLNRVCRLAHVFTFATAHDNGIAQATWSALAVKFSTAIGLVVHTACCCWHVLACQQSRCLPTSWLQTLDAASTTNPGHGYISALYWAAATVTSTGYGDVHAVTVPEMWFAILIMLIGKSR